MTEKIPSIRRGFFQLVKKVSVGVPIGHPRLFLWQTDIISVHLMLQPIEKPRDFVFIIFDHFDFIQMEPPKGINIAQQNGEYFSFQGAEFVSLLNITDVLQKQTDSQFVQFIIIEIQSAVIFTDQPGISYSP